MTGETLLAHLFGRGRSATRSPRQEARGALRINPNSAKAHYSGGSAAHSLPSTSAGGKAVLLSSSHNRSLSRRSAKRTVRGRLWVKGGPWGDARSTSGLPPKSTA